MRKKTVLLLILILTGASAALTGLLLFYEQKMNSFITRSGKAREYDYHYLFISSDHSDLMQDIFLAASESAGEADGYLEWCGSQTDSSYSDADCIDISIAMGADGIVVCPDGSSGQSEAIERAYEAKIPVVTILRDLPDSRRISYAGVSGYQTGELYGERLVGLLRDGVNDVCLLEDAKEGTDGSQLLYTQVVQAVKHEAPSGKIMHLRTEKVDSLTDFDTEEVVRNLLLSDQVPDILICVSPVQTECAIQALVDYNLVGQVQVIGYYVTDVILRALQQQLIPVTMTLDTSQLGKDCMQALEEYRTYGRVSSYYNIPLDSITPVTVDDYIRESGALNSEEGGLS